MVFVPFTATFRKTIHVSFTTAWMRTTIRAHPPRTGCGFESITIFGGGPYRAAIGGFPAAPAAPRRCRARGGMHGHLNSIPCGQFPGEGAEEILPRRPRKSGPQPATAPFSRRFDMGFERAHEG